MSLRTFSASFLLVCLAQSTLFAQGVRFVVEFSGDPDPAIVGGELIRVDGNTVIATLPAAAAAHLAHNPAIANVHEDAIASIPGVHVAGKPGGSGTPSQPAQSTPWGISAISAPTAWAASRGAGIRVAVIDTGIQIGHPDLAGHAVYGTNFVTIGKAPEDDNGHGTHVAGTIGAIDNTIGVVGVAPDCTPVAVKVLDRRGSGYYSNITAGINWAAANNCRVINMSLGGTYNDATMAAAVANATAAGVAVCCATGNEGANGNAASYPGAYPDSIAVAAVDIYGNVAYFSTYGPQVDIAGPGVNVTSTTKGSSYATWNGTSMATPHVAGTAALILGAGFGDVRARILGTATDLNAAGWDQYTGAGRVNAADATRP